jgi:hypothetical protein
MMTNAVELGHELGPRARWAPPPEQIALYVRANGIVEPLFTEPALARALGYRGVVVPGPMLTAFLDQFVRRELPGWRLEALSTTFRIPTIASDRMVFSGVVTEQHHLSEGERIVCDLVIDHADSERAVTGTAALAR